MNQKVPLLGVSKLYNNLAAEKSNVTESSIGGMEFGNVVL